MTNISLLIGEPGHVGTWKREALRYFLKTEVETSFSAAEALEGLRAWERDLPPIDNIVKVVVQDNVPVSYDATGDSDPAVEQAEQEARQLLDAVPEDRRGLELIRHLKHYFAERAQTDTPVEFYLLTEKPATSGLDDSALVTGRIRLPRDSVNYDLVEPHAA